jgi:hypothetical protein
MFAVQGGWRDRMFDADNHDKDRAQHRVQPTRFAPLAGG